MCITASAGASRDGFLNLQDIYYLQLSADMVVLSACRTALGKEVRGEGLVGLTRGFIYAGARRVLAALWKVFEIVQVSPSLIHEAVDCSILNQLSFWDSLILAAAASAGCKTVLSEDLNSGQAILGVRIRKPFA